MDQLELNIQSLKTELKQYKDKPYKCLFEYIWNSFDAGASKVCLSYDTPNQGIGSASNIKISDNGSGWDFSNINTKTFLSSTKSDAKEKNKSLPMGQFGRGRYAFIWIAEQIEITSNNQRITLKHNTEIANPVQIANGIGTEIAFLGAYSVLSDSLTSYEELCDQLLTEFGWFLAQNQDYSIEVNGSPIQEVQIIKEVINLGKDNFPEQLRSEIEENIEIRIVLWSKKPREFSKFYFLDDHGIEIYKENTGLNKKNDNFWHSVYLTSSFFKITESNDDEDEKQTSFDFGDRKKARLQKDVKDFLKSYLINMIRKPYLKEQSEILLRNLKDENLIPKLTEFGIYDVESYDELIKAIYTISPALFTGKSESEKRFVCATFAGLLSNQDDNLIITLLGQLQELTSEEQKDLLDILRRTSLSNIVKTIKEIDHRLEVLDTIKELISEHEKNTLEVKHIQKILNDNFWLFGEQFRLFSSTEGALKKVLLKYAREVLEIEDPELIGNPRGEVDLFLTKTESLGETKQINVIIELKRASKNLGKTQYSQIENYMESIRKESLCNGENQYWEFYLIGKAYDSHIEDKIDSAKNHGLKDRGLTYNIKDGKFKIYVRKWSDILEVEWGTKMKYLKEKLEIKSKQKSSTPDEIVNDIFSNK